MNEGFVVVANFATSILISLTQSQPERDECREVELSPRGLVSFAQYNWLGWMLELKLRF